MRSDVAICSNFQRGRGRQPEDRNTTQCTYSVNRVANVKWRAGYGTLREAGEQELDLVAARKGTESPKNQLDSVARRITRLCYR